MWLATTGCNGGDGPSDAQPDSDGDLEDGDLDDGDPIDGPIDPCPERMVFVDDGEGDAFCIDRFEHPGIEGQAPTVGIPWYEARTLCAELSKELCLEEQWVRACDGTPADACEGNIVPSGRRDGCASAHGVRDLAGNAAEWTASPGGSATFWVRGGSGESAEVGCEAREEVNAEDRRVDLGLRCCARPRR